MNEYTKGALVSLAVLAVLGFAMLCFNPHPCKFTGTVPRGEFCDQHPRFSLGEARQRTIAFLAGGDTVLMNVTFSQTYRCGASGAIMLRSNFENALVNNIDSDHIGCIGIAENRPVKKVKAQDHGTPTPAAPTVPAGTSAPEASTPLGSTAVPDGIKVNAPDAAAVKP